MFLLPVILLAALCPGHVLSCQHLVLVLISWLNGPQHRVRHSHHLLPLCFHNDGLVGLHGLEWEHIPGCRRTGWETLLRPALGPSLSSDLEDSHGACGEAAGRGSIPDSYTVDVCVVRSEVSNCTTSPKGAWLIDIPQNTQATMAFVT